MLTSALNAGDALLFCPYGIDTAEITIFARELLNLLGLNIDWIAGPVAVAG